MQNRKKVLFLDRDGVINTRLVDDYVKDINNFEFIPGVINSIKKFNKVFDRIFVVTNQQGIGKGLMTEDDLKKIHFHMVVQIANSGGKIDGVFYCPHLQEDGCDCRKPKIGMYLQALSLFPEIQDADLYMVGDSKSDMEFARNVGATQVMISSDKNKDYNFVFPSLEKFAIDIYLIVP